MFYKEWLMVRPKLLLAIGVYGLLGFSLVWIWGNNYQTNTTMFLQWAQWSVVALVVLGILGGMDIVSDETDKNTLSFLLARPFSRDNIFFSKIGLNGLVLGGTYLVASGAVFVADQIPRTVSQTQQVWNGCANINVYAGEVLANPTPLQSAGIAAAIALTFGLLALSLSSALSVFTRTAMQTLVFTITVVVAMIGLVVWLGASSAVLDIFKYPRIEPLAFIGFATLLCLHWGSYAFRTKEF